MNDSSPSGTKELPNPTIPIDIKIAAIGFDCESKANEVSQNLYNVMWMLSRIIDLSGLDGITLAYDYDKALEELDRGFEATRTLKRSTGVVYGIAMAAPVKRNGQIKSHLVFYAPVINALLDDKDEHFQFSLHTVSHECAHVHITQLYVQAFPDLMFSSNPRSYASAHIHRAWDEYAVCRLVVKIGEDPTDNYQFTLEQSLESTKAEANAAILKYRTHGDHGRIANEIFEIYGKLLIYSAYFLGSYSGKQESTQVDSIQIKGLEGHWFEKYFFKLNDIFETIFDQRGSWQNHDSFDELDELLVQIVKEGGLFVTQLEDGAHYVEVPFK